MYRTAYRDMSVKEQAPKKNIAVPGYGGYIPSKAAGEELGRTFTKTSRQCLADSHNVSDKFSYTFTNFKNHQVNFDE